jgi:hypothetical protein
VQYERNFLLETVPAHAQHYAFVDLTQVHQAGKLMPMIHDEMTQRFGEKIIDILLERELNNSFVVYDVPKYSEVDESLPDEMRGLDIERYDSMLVMNVVERLSRPILQSCEGIHSVDCRYHDNRLYIANDAALFENENPQKINLGVRSLYQLDKAAVILGMRHSSADELLVFGFAETNDTSALIVMMNRDDAIQARDGKDRDELLVDLKNAHIFDGHYITEEQSQQMHQQFDDLNFLMSTLFNTNFEQSELLFQDNHLTTIFEYDVIFNEEFIYDVQQTIARMYPQFVNRDFADGTVLSELVTDPGWVEVERIDKNIVRFNHTEAQQQYIMRNKNGHIILSKNLLHENIGVSLGEYKNAILKKCFADRKYKGLKLDNLIYFDSAPEAMFQKELQWYHPRLNQIQRIGLFDTGRYYIGCIE